jgi:mannose-6-phosphate isomerase
MVESRPWGQYTILYEDQTCKVKRIVVNVGHKLSLQYHHKRDETWKIVSGIGEMTLEDDKFLVYPEDVVRIDRNVLHRVENIDQEPLVFIEVQTGKYFGEDDIIRIQDDYGRL